METRSIPFVTTASFPKLLTEDRRLILAAALGTIFEWYDFFLYGSLAVTISKQFFSGVDETTGFMFALLAFAAGFIVRPFGAAFFGRLGDLIGRKHTFLMTMFLMGLATVSVGLLPGYARIGMAAPILLISLRLLQGLALGGEYGGAAVYVAEQAPANQRGYCTSWIQATASLGLLLSLVVILCCRLATKSAFDVWGWRIPFLFSSVLLGVSLWIRLSMKESQGFSAAPRRKANSLEPRCKRFSGRRRIFVRCLWLCGMVAGMTAVWYTAQFYALYFLIQSLRVAPMTANLLMGGAIVLGSPFIILSGRLSDRIGRKPVMMTGMLVAALTLIPVFKGLTHYANPQLAAAAHANPVTVAADLGHLRIPIRSRRPAEELHRLRQSQSFAFKMGVPYANSSLPAGSASDQGGIQCDHRI